MLCHESATVLLPWATQFLFYGLTSPRVVRIGKSGVMPCAVGRMKTGSAVTRKIKTSAT
jgi:hypothetical protein